MLGASHALLTTDTGIDVCDLTTCLKERFGLLFDGLGCS